MKRITAALGVMLVALSAGPSWAQGLALELEDAEIFRPTTDGGDFVTVYDSGTLPPMNFQLGLYGDYARNPLEIQFESSGDRFSKLVKDLGTMQLSAALGLFRNFHVGVRIPGYILNTQGVSIGGASLTSGGTDAEFGDVVLNAKYTLLDRDRSGVGLAILPEVTLPSGNGDNFAGTGKLGYGGLLVLDFAIGRNFVIGINGGGLIRDEPGGGPLKDSGDDYNDQLRYGLGMAYAFSERFSGIGEVYGGADVSDPFDLERKTPLDAIGALRFNVARALDLTFGGGAGLTNGQGSPDFRVFVGLTTPRPKKQKATRGADLSQSRKTYAIEDLDRDGRPSPGDVILYTVTIVNSGTETATNVIVTDPIPDYVTYVPGSLAVNGRPVTDARDGDDGEVSAGAPATLAARIAQLPADPVANSGTVSFRVRIDPNLTQITKVTNQATVSADQVPQTPLPPADITVLPAVRESERVIVTPERLELTEEIHFEFDKATIQRESYPILKELAAVLQNYPTLRINIDGNTDSVGSESYNQRLSELRAKSVRDFLIGAGIDKSRLETVGYGEGKPIAPNDTAAGRAKNRRTEFIVLNPEALGDKRIETRKQEGDVAPESEPEWLKRGEKPPPGAQ